MIAELKAISETSSRKEKEALLKELITKDKNAMKLILISLDSGIQFNIKKYDKTGSVGTEIKENDLYTFFIELIDRLNNGLSGNELKNHIESNREKMSEECQWLFDGIIRKSIGIGIGSKTMMKVMSEVYPDMVLKSGDAVMTAEDSSCGTKYVKLNTPYAVEPKLDGERIKILFTPNKGFECFSRDGKEQPNYKKYLEKYLGDIEVKQPLFLDAEITHVSGVFDNIAGKGKAKYITIEDGEAIVNIFDIVAISHENTKYSVRKDMLDLFYKKELLTHYSHIFKVVHYETVVFESKSDVLELTKEYVNKGYEGIMIKDMDAPYEYKRSRSWIKSKLIITADLRIIDVYRGEEGKKYQDVAGGIIVADAMGNTTSVGSGFTDVLRKELWENKDSYKGRIAEIMAQSPTKSHSLRFPRFVRFRDDKNSPDNLEAL